MDCQTSFNTELNSVCIELFEKCAIRTSTALTTSSMLQSSDASSYVLCADVINLINQGLTNNKLMSSNNEINDCTLNESTLNNMNNTNASVVIENNESIKYLKRLFCDHFKIDESDLETRELKLDLTSLNTIFQIWIKKLSLNSNSTGFVNNDLVLVQQQDDCVFNKQHVKKEYNNCKELRNSLKKIRKLNTNKENPLMMMTQDETNNSEEATSSSSSLPSVSLNSSDDDGLLSLSKLNSEHNSNSDIENLELNDELMSENFRLKKTINDMKYQLSNAEDLNAQMGQEIEQLNNRNLCLNKINYELINKVNSMNDDNEQNTKLIEQYKTRIESLITENKTLTTDVKMFKNKCSTYENEIFNLKSQIEMNEFDKESLLMDLNEQKSLLNQLENYNSKLEQNLFEAKSKYIEQEREIEKLNEIIQDKRKENENLNEKNNILADKYKNSNTKLLRKNFYSNEAINNTNSSCSTTSSNTNKNRYFLSPSYTFSTNTSLNATKLTNETQTECDEAESLMNIYIAANLNDNTFHLSPNEANFFSEQFEFQNKLEEESLPDTTSKSDENIIEQFQLFLNKIDQIKLQYDELKKYDTLDSRNINCNLDLDKTYLAKSFKTMLETFFGYLYDKNKNEIKQNLETIVNQSKKIANTNKQLNEQFTSALQKIKLLSNQVNFYKVNNTLTSVTSKKCKQTQQKSNSNELHELFINDWSKLKDSSEQKQKCYSEQNLFESQLKSTPNPSTKVTSMSIDCLNENLTDHSCTRTEKNLDDKHLSSSSNSSINSNENSVKSRMINKALNEIIGFKSFSNFDANDADVDDDESSECKKNFCTTTKPSQNRSILAAKRYSSSCNQIRSKPLNGLIDDDDVSQDVQDEAVLNLKCSTCQESYQISLSGPKLRSILSLDLTLDSKNDPCLLGFNNLTSSIISNQRDAATQTVNEPTNSLVKNKKHDYLMQHQLTRDSGIDSDHQTQYKFNQVSINTTNVTSIKSKKQQIIIPISKCEEKVESQDVNLEDDYDDHESKEFLTSSTRDNSSVDIQNSSSLDDPDDAMLDSFKPIEEVKKKPNEMASSRRLLFKNSNKSTLASNPIKRQQNFYSFQLPDESISPSPTDKQFELEDKLEKHSLQIESSKPMIHFTSISKLSDQLQNDKEANKVNLTIDDILNVVDEPVSVPNKTLMSYRDRNQLRRNSSLSDNNSSINEDTIYSCFDDIQDHKLKQLESNFNQIAMAHHSDELVVENNIELYKDKYKKANNYMDLLFDEITTSMNKMLNLLINEQLESTTACNSIESSDYFNSSMMNTSRTYSSSIKYKKLMQENLNLLNKTIERVRKNLICLVTTSSTISGLKQEAHLSELFKITISYVKELKRSMLNNSNKSSNVSKRERHLNQSSGYKRSLTSYESLEIADNSKPIEDVMMMSVGENDSIHTNKNLFSTISLIKSFSTQSHTSSRKRNKRSNSHMITSLSSDLYPDEKISNKHDYYDDDNFSISDNLNLLKSASYMSTSVSIDKPTIEQDSKHNEPINEQTNLVKEKTIVDNNNTNKFSNLNTKLKNVFKLNLEKYSHVKERCSELVELVRKDSFKPLRIACSAFLLIVSLLLFVCACLQDEDVYEKMFNYFINNVEIKNPDFGSRSI